MSKLHSQSHCPRGHLARLYLLLRRRHRQPGSSATPPAPARPNNFSLPAPFATPSVRNNSKVIGWPKGKMPTAAPGFEVSLFADKLDNPRQAYVLPNKDILVVEAIREFPGRADRPEKSANRITLVPRHQQRRQTRRARNLS